VRRELAKLGVGAGFSFGYSFSESHATSVTVSGTCPKHHQCQQQATAQMLHVKGTQTTHFCHNGEPEAPVTQDFEVFYPVTYAGSAQDSETVITYSICTIGEKKNKQYPVCLPAGGEPRPFNCDPIGAKMVNQAFNPTCR
jgi:hypothetical protein